MKKTQAKNGRLNNTKTKKGDVDGTDEKLYLTLIVIIVLATSFLISMTAINHFDIRSTTHQKICLENGLKYPYPLKTGEIIPPQAAEGYVTCSYEVWENNLLTEKRYVAIKKEVEK